MGGFIRNGQFYKEDGDVVRQISFDESGGQSVEKEWKIGSVGRSTVNIPEGQVGVVMKQEGSELRGGEDPASGKQTAQGFFASLWEKVFNGRPKIISLHD